MPTKIKLKLLLLEIRMSLGLFARLVVIGLRYVL